MSEQKQYLRFSIAQRIEHWAQMLSFTGLALTGIPQKFVGNGWAETWIQLLGGIEIVRIIHHTSAIVMALTCIYHVVVVAYKIFVLRVRWTMFPRLDDLFDALDVVRYNLGLTKEKIKLDRFSFEEKAEYWAFVWGAVLMGFTGFMMWNPINTARFVPGDLLPAAKAAHGGEALLAVLAIIVWHSYGVHIKAFSKAMFTGNLSEHAMEHEHPLELERIQAGRVDAVPDPATIKKRERLFIPVAAILSALMLVALYLFVTYEQTALTTLPRRAQVQIYAPITPTPTPRAGASAPTLSAAAKPLPDSHAGRTACLACHANNIGPNLPADHAGRTDATCSACHKPAGAAPAPTVAPTSVPATRPAAATAAPTAAPTTAPATKPAAATAAPTAAPTTGAPAAPTTAPATKPAAATTAPTTAPASAGPKPIPADHVGRTTCNACHETGAVSPKSPADHAGRTDAMCMACHKPQ
jgi:cytochrome b subunit of formate dehydrogenase